MKFQSMKQDQLNKKIGDRTYQEIDAIASSIPISIDDEPCRIFTQKNARGRTKHQLLLEWQ